MQSKNTILNKIKYSEIDNFVFDLDGTLLNKDSELIPENLQTIKELQEDNKNIIIATGRPLYTAQKIIDQIQVKFPIILANGALIWDNKKDQLYKSFAIKKSSAKAIYKKLVDMQYEFLVYVPGKILGFNSNKTDFFTKKNYPVRVGENHYAEGNFLETFDNYDACKFFVIKNSNSDESWDEFKTFLKDYDEDAHGLISEWPNLDIMSNNSSKGEALKYLFKDFNLDINKTISFGDAENDVSMFRVTKYSGSFSNSKHKDVLNHASIIFDSNNEPWFANFIKQIKNNK